MSAPRQRIKDMIQLELDLFAGEPWGGHSPRALTKAALAFIFKPQGAKARALFKDPDQLELWAAKKKRGPRRVVSPGAPSLIPFPWEVNDG